MKVSRIQRFIRGTLAASLVGVTIFVSAPANAAHEMIYAVDQNNNLFNFYSDTPQFLLTQFPITGLQLNEEIRGLDYYNGTIYGLPKTAHPAEAYVFLNHKLLEAAHSFGAGEWHLFKTIIFPSSVPFIITGLRLGVARGLVSIIVGELYAANAGIGYFIILAGTSFQTTKVFVGVLLFAISGVVLVSLLSRVERRFDRWRPKVGARA